MKIIKILIFFWLIISVSFFAQPSREWVNRYNGSANKFDIASTLKIDQQGNPVVFGNISQTGSFTDITAIKYSPAGSILWQAVFNGYGSGIDECKDAVIAPEGSCYITGFTADTSQVIKMVTIKISSTGDILWHNVFMPAVYNQGIGLGITIDDTGNIIVCGSFRRANGTNTTAVLKYSPAGNLLGSVYFNKTSLSSETPVSVCADNSGNIYVLASSNAVGGVNDILMLKFSPQLSLMWQNTFSGSAFGSDIPVKMILSGDNKLVVAAAVYNAPGGFDYAAYRFDTSSALIMQYFYNGTGNNQDIPYDITCDSANNIFITGSSRNFDTLGSEDIYTMKIDPTAVLLWGKRFDGFGRGLDYGTTVAVDNRGNVFVGGTTDKHDFHQQYALLKYGHQGDLHWLEEYSVIENSEDFVYTAACDNNGSVYITGISFDSASDYDITTIKYSEPIGINNISSEVPDDFMLYQNYPNPFNPLTKFRFQIPAKGKSQKAKIEISIYDLLGKKIAEVTKKEYSPGIYEAEFDGSNLPSGVYFCRLTAEEIDKSIKIMLLK